MSQNKYRNVPTTVHGIRFHSAAEAARYGELLLLARAGKITHLELQPRYPLWVNMKPLGFYVADFRYQEDGVVQIEEVKGYWTPLAKLKVKLFEAIYGIRVRVIAVGAKAARSMMRQAMGGRTG